MRPVWYDDHKQPIDENKSNFMLGDSLIVSTSLVKMQAQYYLNFAGNITESPDFDEVWVAIK